jgi:hypothetical protein
MLAQANISKVLKTLLMWSIIRFKARLWVSYIFGSNKDFEERKSSVETLTKVVLESFYKTYGFRMSIC